MKKSYKQFDPEKDRPEIVYPCQWQYKVIGKDEELVQKAINEICAPTPTVVNLSNQSSSGKYYSFNVELEVKDEKQRDELFGAFQNHSDITMVI